MYEISNIVPKRETFSIVHSLSHVTEAIMERYNRKEDNTIVAKVIHMQSNEQLTIEIGLTAVHQGIKRSNPNALLAYNTDPTHFVCINLLQQPIIKSIPFIDHFFHDVNKLTLSA
jgi:hypothetical protein